MFVKVSIVPFVCVAIGSHTHATPLQPMVQFQAVSFFLSLLLLSRAIGSVSWPRHSDDNSAVW